MKCILVSPCFYNATDKEILETGKMFKGVPIAYGSSSYNKNVSRVNEIFSRIKEDYPDIKEDDVEIRILSMRDSDIFANTLVLEFKVSAEKFILLRNLKLIRSY